MSHNWEERDRAGPMPATHARCEVQCHLGPAGKGVREGFLDEGP